MSFSYDLITLPICRQPGADQPEAPGFLALAPPRRVGRGRAQDFLLMHLALDGNAPLSAQAQSRLLQTLAETYYKTPGSTTAAMRVVAESLNQSLFERNQRGTGRGLRALGIFSLAVFRSRRLYLAQSGGAQALLIGAGGVQFFCDPAASGRGLGMGRATPLQYHQAEVAPGDALLLGPVLPESWRQPAFYGLRAEQIHPRLLALADADVAAILVQVAPGRGNLRALRPVAATGGKRAAPEEAASPEGARSLKANSPSEIPGGVPSSGVDSPPFGVARQPESAAHPPAPKTSPPSDSADQPAASSPPRKPRLAPALRMAARAVGITLAQLWRGLTTLLRRLLPDEKMLELPSSTLFFIAVAVPLLVVTVASVVYFREGRLRLHQERLLQAQVLAEQALPLQDPLEMRAAWGRALTQLDAAEAVAQTPDSQSLRLYAYSVLDRLDLVERLDFQPGIVRGLADDAQIVRMAASMDNELYLLDGPSGRVLRAVYGDQGYVLDPRFNCGPVPAPLIVGKLVAIAALPRGQADGATLLGMDANGMLMRCIPGEGKTPNLIPMPPPDINWGEPRAFSWDGGNLYVLDPQTNAVWVYWAIDNFGALPTYYFGNQVPTLKNVVDMAVGDGDLYLLHEDGQMTTCTYSAYADAPTRCTDPAGYADLRAGYSSGPIMAETHFSQMQFSPPPDPSLYLFDPADQAIYHFSLRLAFQRQYRPLNPLPGGVSAFAVSPNRQAFIAAGNQVYYALMP